MGIITPHAVLAPSEAMIAMIENGHAPALETVHGFPDKEITLRVNRVEIVDISEPFWDSEAEIVLISVVVDSHREEPFYLNVETFEGVERRTDLPIGDPGWSVYFRAPDELPRYLDWRFLIMESDNDIRRVGRMIQKVKAMPQFHALRDQAIALASASNPVHGMLATLADQLINLFASQLVENDDDVISLYRATFTAAFDNLGLGSHGFRHAHKSKVEFEILHTEADCVNGLCKDEDDID